MSGTEKTGKAIAAQPVSRLAPPGAWATSPGVAPGFMASEWAPTIRPVPPPSRRGRMCTGTSSRHPANGESTSSNRSPGSLARNSKSAVSPGPVSSAPLRETACDAGSSAPSFASARQGDQRRIRPVAPQPEVRPRVADVDQPQAVGPPRPELQRRRIQPPVHHAERRVVPEQAHPRSPACWWRCRTFRPAAPRRARRTARPEIWTSSFACEW